MCACNWNFTCSRCRGTQHDPRYLLEVDPAELEYEARQRVIHGDGSERSEEVGITRGTI